MAGDLVSAEWLAIHLGDPHLVILDCSWHLPAAQRDARAEYLSGHIPGALFCDLDTLFDQSGALPHMLPTGDDFTARVSAMGIDNSSHVICYDAAGLFSAARVWWMFKVFGLETVLVLDGGLPKWKSHGFPLEAGEGVTAAPRKFTVRFDKSRVADMKAVRIADQVADARSPARYRGEEPEPRPGVRPGHIPGSRNLHYAKLFAADGTMKSPNEIAALFTDAGLDVTQPIVTSCGSGVTAAILTLGLTLIGSKDHSLYDGSWAEWGAACDVTIATGPGEQENTKWVPKL
jgi:thiosulfate/3-mercaptopyruvate sulfurtransferase